jgi:coenzyme F420-reducing hydrogenase beta subunit
VLDFVVGEAERCDGCEACASVCPAACIELREDEEGFRYPRVDPAACTECGACEEVCPALSPSPAPGSAAPAVFAARSLDAATRAASSSGGVFSAIAEDVLARGGAVFGARFDGSLQLGHAAAERLADLAALRGSKYLPSLVGGAFEGVRRTLEAGRPVAFVGTPCQVGGLRAFLHARPARGDLVTIDLVCHGVPSLRAFRAYTGWLERRQASRLTGLEFRGKRTGWKRFEVVATFEDGAEYRAPFGDDPYMRAFLWNLCLRPACHACRWARIPRVGDLTLGDYWGIERVRPDLDDDRGTSVVLVSTPRGEEALARVRGRLAVDATALEAAVAGNVCLVRPVPASPGRPAFLRDLAAAPFETVMKRHLRDRPPLLRRVARRVRSSLRSLLRLAGR